MTIEPFTTPSAGRLVQKIAPITGASLGIGSAIARLFAREGAGVMLAALLWPSQRISRKQRAWKRWSHA
jgi:NADP-dependent 3-hydroxy acid dehydrogenase YdfG